MPWKKPKPLPSIWKYLGRANWASGAFHQDKALVCCVFAEYAYRHIPRFELEETDRIKLLPCFAYLRLTSQGVEHLVEEELGPLDFGNTFIEYTDQLIALAVRTPHVIIIAIRGTRATYFPDWGINLDVEPISFPGFEGAFLHRGFYTAIKELGYKLSTKLLNLNWHDLPVCVTGHSLGGAMAAILHGLWERILPALEPAHLHSLSAYTFGMPRYGNDNAIYSMPFPFHIYRQRDLVPSVVPKVLGYVDSPDEYLCARNELLPKGHDDHSAAVKAFRALPIPGFVLRNHSIEGYRKRIHRIVREADERKRKKGQT